MAVKSLNPYLNYPGNASQAIAFYEKALGAKKESVMTFGDIPDMKVPDAQKGLVMHAALNIGGGQIMLSDAQPNQPPVPGTNNYVALHLDDVADAEKKFNALAEGGKVMQPLTDAFWGAKFGSLTDKFGIYWMFNCELKAQ